MSLCISLGEELCTLVGEALGNMVGLSRGLAVVVGTGEGPIIDVCRIERIESGFTLSK